MDATSAFTFKDLFTFLAGDMAKAICERNGETQTQKMTRTQAAAQMIVGFMPRDVIEVMLAGHCMMFHELMVDSVHHTLAGEMDATRRATRSGIVAMDKCFGNNLTRLEGYRLRHAEGEREVPAVAPGKMAIEELAAASVTPLTDSPTAQARARTEVGATGAVETRTRPARSRPDPFGASSPIGGQASPEAIAACRANPAAMAALDAGDAEAFARAMGIDMPSEHYLTAAGGEGSMFDGEASGVRPPRVPKV
jgi:hypothetical protein